MSNLEQFRNLYNKLESTATAFYRKGKEYPPGESFTYDLMNDRRFQAVIDKIHYCREVRNVVQHKSGFRVEPSDDMIKFLEDLIHSLTNPVRIYDRCIKEVRTAKPTDKALPIMREMGKRNFTHIPIIDENECVTGVFSESVLFRYVAEKGIIDVDANTPISDYEDYLPLDKEGNETFGFVARNATLFDVKKMFEDAYEDGKRLGMIFITESGIQKQKILGIVTAFDILGR